MLCFYLRICTGDLGVGIFVNTATPSSLLRKSYHNNHNAQMGVMKGKKANAR